ncbi:hypothetical protein [Nitrosopumilus maritimus]|uniref:Uncharacterized protein n=1 Tax=Nitrosopumilus maritimus (strain SCM1) TaxID=436308 RepID=A9A5Q5_NITMS|nr:hypothetical protein [Nitrosopumilus maritimus]ABX13060.1 hypothetical protein Nmar_1164 [Nitrosopumilus maritimus SCM1]
MYLDSAAKYRIKIDVGQIIQSTVASQCERHLANNLNFLDHLTCSIANNAIEIIFNPPDNVTDKYLFELITTTLQQAGVSYLRAILSIYVGSSGKTAGGTILGALMGLKFGPIGGVLGAAAGAGAAKFLFDWKNLCECTDDELGHLVIRDYGENHDGRH